jgi:CheY-like chemotaxis protein
MDLPHRLERTTKLPVTHIMGEEPSVAEEAQLAKVPFPGVPPTAESSGAVRVLLVEDDEADAELTQEALKRCTPPSDVTLVGNGAEAISWLRAAGGPAGVDLVLVDLKMPVVDGFQLLEMIGQEHDLETLAVAVVSTSNRMEDRERAHGLGAHAYVTKDASFPLYVDLLQSLLSDVVKS